MSLWRYLQRFVARYKRERNRAAQIAAWTTANAAATPISARVGPKRDPAFERFLALLEHPQDRFADDAQKAAWQELQRTGLEIALRAIAASPASNNLILRGSVLMQSWYGDKARAPRDIDFVVTPMQIDKKSARAQHLRQTLIKSVVESPESNGRFSEQRLRITDLWTYTDAVGSRIVFYWQQDGLPWNAIQIDLSFEEPLLDELVKRPVAVRDGMAPIDFYIIGKAHALASKLFWLQVEEAPRTKDLQDAVLLAEALVLDRELTSLVINESARRMLAPHERTNLTTDFDAVISRLESAAISWQGFQHEDREWLNAQLQRLAIALAI